MTPREREVEELTSDLKTLASERGAAGAVLPLPAPGPGQEQPPVTREQMERMLAEATGDVVYGVAAVDGAFFVRTGTELYCVGRPR